MATSSGNFRTSMVHSDQQESRLRMELASSRTRQNNDHPECLDCMNGILAVNLFDGNSFDAMRIANCS